MDKKTRELNVMRKHLRYAGLKDKCAHTVQVVTAYRVSPENLSTAIHKDHSWYNSSLIMPTTQDLIHNNGIKNRTKHRTHSHNQTKQQTHSEQKNDESTQRRNINHPQMRIGNVSLVSKQQYVGNLSGNRFTLCLRDVKTNTETSVHLSSRTLPHNHEQKVIDDCIIDWESRGFINFFGLQRFGISAAASTSKVGLAMFQGRFQDVLTMLFSTSDFVHSNKLVKDGQRQQRRNPPSLHLLAIIKALRTKYPTEWDRIQCQDDFAKIRNSIAKDVLHKLPHHMIRLYLNAYQSWVWNRLASQCVLRNSRHEIKGTKSVYEKLSNRLIALPGNLFHDACMSNDEVIPLYFYLLAFRS